MPCAVEHLGDGFPVSVTGATNEDSSYEGSCGGERVGEKVFAWTAPAAGEYQFSTVGSSFDTLLYVRSSCDGGEKQCNDDIRDGMTRSRITLSMSECETVAIFVDGFNREAHGDFVLSVSGTESDCENGVDDDNDGAADCEDLDCYSERCITGGEWPADWSSLEAGMLSEVNRYRAMGYRCTDAAEDNFPPAGPLEEDTVIRVAARLHSKDMGDQNYFEHESLDGREFSDRMEMAGFSGDSPWGENIAAGYGTAEEAVLGLMRSPGHCRNIMNDEYRVVGYGYYYTEDSEFGHYWTQNFAASH